MRLLRSRRRSSPSPRSSRRPSASRPCESPYRGPSRTSGGGGARRSSPRRRREGTPRDGGPPASCFRSSPMNRPCRRRGFFSHGGDRGNRDSRRAPQEGPLLCVKREYLTQRHEGAKKEKLDYRFRGNDGGGGGD